MATFTVSPAVVSALTARATNPSLGVYTLTSPYSSASLSFLNLGGIQFLNSGLSVLVGFGFHEVGYSLWSNTVTFSGTTIGSQATFTHTAGRPDIYPGLRVLCSQGLYEVVSYNVGTGAVVMQLISGAGFSGSVSTNLQIASGVASRSSDSSTGYVTFNNFPALTPILSGTIDYVLLRDAANNFGITFTAGDIGSGADIEISDRTVTTAQPWQLSGSIRVRLPMSYNYTL